MQHTTGVPFDRVSLRKFCLTKGSLFDQENALQKGRFQLKKCMFIDREAGEIIRLVASVRPFVCLFVCWCSPA